MTAMPLTARGAVAATSLAARRGPRAGARGRARPVEASDQAVAWDEGVITYVGPADGLVGFEPEWFEGCTIAPGFVDRHTHLPFAGWRADEFEARLSGVSYRELHGEGGIYRSARMLAEASDDEVLAFCRSLVQEMADHGTTALELKTGYGLSVEAELRQARLARRLAEEAPQTCSVTLACHAVPEGMERADWVRAVCDELIPEAVREGLVDAVDVYVEDIAFSLDDLERSRGAPPRSGSRCDVTPTSSALGRGGGRRARRIERRPPEPRVGGRDLGARRRAGHGRRPAPDVDAVPALDAPGRPSADRRGSGGRDRDRLQPGTSPVLSMPEAIATACSLYGLRPLEALAAATENASAALGLAPERGTLAPGRPADLVVLDGDAFRMVPYRPGHNPVVRTFVDGERVGGR